LFCFAANLLLYTEKTWNLPGTSDIEELSWSSLSDTQKFGASSIGFTEPTWDCWQNHFGDYLWRELAPEAESALTALGYNQVTWDNDRFIAVEDDYWVEMDDDNDANEDKIALATLCYQEETWDGVLPLFATPLADITQTPCADVDFGVSIAMLNAHVYSVVTPTKNDNPKCQSNVILHDHGRTKAAFNFSNENVQDWGASKLLFINTFKWETLQERILALKVLKTGEPMTS